MFERKRLTRVMAWTLAAGVTIFAVASCGKKESATEEAKENASEAAKPALSDANIAAIVVAANNADIDNGKQALTKTKNADVKAFAKLMIADHGSVNDKAAALAAKLSLTPEDDDTSRNLKAGQDSVRAAIQAKTGSDFNKAYIDNEVTYHQTVLDALDQTLIPNAQNAELKQLLTDVRPTIAAHLDHAKSIQTKLGGTAAK